MDTKIFVDADIKLVMEPRVRNVLEYLHAHPDALTVARELALKSKDESVPSIERMTALLALNDLMISLDALIHDDSKDGTPHPEDAEYRWVNGAKVRVKK